MLLNKVLIPKVILGQKTMRFAQKSPFLESTMRAFLCFGLALLSHIVALPAVILFLLFASQAKEGIKIFVENSKVVDNATVVASR